MEQLPRANKERCEMQFENGTRIRSKDVSEMWPSELHHPTDCSRNTYSTNQTRSKQTNENTINHRQYNTIRNTIATVMVDMATMDNDGGQIKH